MLIRTERSEDVDDIAAVLADAFRRPDADTTPPEVDLVSALRAGDAWIPQQSQVAVEGDVVIGHCLCTRAFLEGTRVLALGPIGVVQRHQSRGVGSALMRNAIAVAEGMGEQLIGLLGDPAYYGRFGFRPAAEAGVEPPDLAWGSYFQVLRLACDTGATGRFTYPEPFLSMS